MFYKLSRTRQFETTTAFSFYILNIGLENVVFYSFYIANTNEKYLLDATL